MEIFPKKLIIAVGVISVLLSGYFIIFGLSYGPILTSDGEREIAYAIALRELNFNIFRYSIEAEKIAGISYSVPLQFYLIFVTLLSIIEYLFGPAWLTILIILNGFFQAFSSSIILLVSGWLGGTFLIAIIASLLILLFDSYQWVAMSQSEPLFIAFSTAAIASAAMTVNTFNKPKSLFFWGLAILLTLLAIFTRPTWPPLVFTVLFMPILIRGMDHKPLNNVVRTWFIFFGTGTLVLIILIFLSSAVFLDPSLAPVTFLKEAAIDWRQWHVDGMVVIERPETFLVPQESLWGFSKLSLMRLVYFFWFSADGFSNAHNWINIIGHIPLYGLAIIGIVTTFRIPELPLFARSLGIAGLTYILAADAYHAITILDFDWRYRAPIYPWLLILAAIGGWALGRERIRFL